MFRRIFHLAQNQQQADVESGKCVRNEKLDFGHGSWMRAHHRDNLISKLEHPKDGKHSYHINFTELQRLHLRQLQHKLLQHTIDLRHRSLEPSRWAEDLQRYVQALQDYDYMGKFKDSLYDPFIITGERYVERCMLDVAMDGLENSEDPLGRLKSSRRWEDESARPAPIGGTRTQNHRNTLWWAFRDRIVLAALGGVFLVGPMWLMILHNTLYTVLISTTVLIFVFGFLMALLLTKPMDVMASTAAYAAVLVVFVGLNVDSNAAASV
ncbi:hypothetical protein E8E14_009591 [Neopestalotiopsis sp. 37M]|nr:hypothetical protein E8E14_009591 [Neopestalotiopsis sp. 37M]